MATRHPSTNHFVMGSSNTICDRTGFKRKIDELDKEWTGHIVIPEAFNERHPQDFPFVPVEEPTFPDARAEEADPTDSIGSITVI